jgi:hypothetical protein
MTRNINDTIADNEAFSKEILTALRRYVACDWGDLCKEDKGLNNSAVKSGNDRILAAYSTSEGKVYIITEYNREYTTILFAEEY